MNARVDNRSRRAGPEPSAEYVTTAELCRRLSISRRTVGNHRLHRYAIQVGSQWRFDWGKVEQHYTRHGTAAQR